MTNKVSHVSAEHTRLYSLDLLRSCAIILVFLHHYTLYAAEKWLGPISKFGWIGVDLFFVLSGYLIGSQLLKPVAQGRLPSYLNFYLKRSFRILPCYFTVLAIYFLIPAWNGRDGISPLWRFLTFTENFGLNWEILGSFSHSWSLCVEEHFYLILPVVVILMTRYRLGRYVIPLLTSTVILGLVLRAYLWFEHVEPIYHSIDHKELSQTFYREIYYPTYNRMDGLLMGLTLALVYRLRPQLWNRLTTQGNAMIALGFVLLGVSYFVCLDLYSLASAVLGYPLLALSFGCLVLGALSPGNIFSKIKLPGAGWMATLAFTFYLLHMELIWIFHKLLSPLGLNPNGGVIFGLTFALCIGASLLLHLAVERPFLAFRDLLLKDFKSSKALFPQTPGLSKPIS